MALTAYGRNTAIAAVTAKTNPTSAMEYVGLAESLKEKLTSGTAVAASLINLTGAKAKGFTNGKIVMIQVLGGAVTNLEKERPYYIVGEVTNGFELALEEGGTAIKVEGAELTTATEIRVLTEISGGSPAYARVVTSWGAASADKAEDTAKEKINVPASKTVTDALWFSISAGGSFRQCMAANKLTAPETFNEQGVYELTSDKLEAPPNLA